MAKVLIIDDDPFVGDLLTTVLAQSDIKDVDCAHSLRDGLKHSQQSQYDLIFLDVLLPDGDGLEMMEKMMHLPGNPGVIIITGAGNPESAESALSKGAWDYILKPINAPEVTRAARHALVQRKKQMAMEDKRAKAAGAIIGDSPKIRSCLGTLMQAAGTSANCLITGETGTGKELFARAIHDLSTRASESFVVVDRTNIPENLAESVLFGHRKGAFTDARDTRDGLFKQADKGTLMLDEIGDLRMNTQKSLLRVLQEKRFRPIGSKTEVHSDFRLIAATNRDIPQMIEDGQFRKDLFYRLSAITIQLPPLCEREGDVELLAREFIKKTCKGLGVPEKKPSSMFLNALNAYTWPGNVRDLLNAVNTAVTLAQDEEQLELYHLPMEIRIHLKKLAFKDTPDSDGVDLDLAAIDREMAAADADAFPSFKEVRTRVVDEMERLYFTRLLERLDGGHKEACKISGLSRARLYELLKKHDLNLR